MVLAEIAHSLDVPVGTVQSRLLYARNELKMRERTTQLQRIRQQAAERRNELKKMMERITS